LLPRTQIYLLYFDTQRCRAMCAGPYDPYDDYSAMWAHAEKLHAAGHEDIDRLRSPVPPPMPPGRLLTPARLAELL
jgi:hypothetical protein